MLPASDDPPARRTRGGSPGGTRKVGAAAHGAVGLGVSGGLDLGGPPAARRAAGQAPISDRPQATPILLPDWAHERTLTSGRMALTLSFLAFRERICALSAAVEWPGGPAGAPPPGPSRSRRVTSSPTGCSPGAQQPACFRAT